MATPVVEDFNQTGSVGTSPVSVPIPDNCAVGDLVCIFWRVNGATTVTFGTPAFTVQFEDSQDASNDRTGFAYRRIDGTEGWSGGGNSRSTTITPSTNRAAFIVWRISGAEDPGIRPPIHSVPKYDTTAISADANTVTPIIASKDYLYLLCVAYDGTNTPSFTPPTGYTFDTNQNTGGASTANLVTILGAHKSTTNTSSEDPGAWTIGVPNAASTTVVIAISPVIPLETGEHRWPVVQIGQDITGAWSVAGEDIDLQTFQNGGLIVDATVVQSISPLPTLTSMALDLTLYRTAAAGTNHLLELGVVPLPAPADYSTALLPWTRSEISLGTFDLGIPMNINTGPGTPFILTFSGAALTAIQSNCIVSGWSGKVAISFRSTGTNGIQLKHSAADAIFIDKIQSAVSGVDYPRSAAAAGIGTVSAGHLVARPRSAAVAGVGTVTAGIAVQRQRTAPVAGIATVSALSGVTRSRAAASAGVATVTAPRLVNRPRAAAAAGVATITVSYVKTSGAQRFATVTGVATVAAGRTLQRRVSAPVAGIGTVSALGLVNRPRSAAVAGVATITVAYFKSTGTQRSASIAGVATVAAGHLINRGRSAAAAGVATVLSSYTLALRRSALVAAVAQVVALHSVLSTTKLVLDFEPGAHPRYSLRRAVVGARYALTPRVGPRYAFLTRTRKEAS